MVPFPDPRGVHSQSEPVDVIVVGAGLAGLIAAHTLAAADVRFVVLEARDRVGGRTLAVTEGDGPAVDVGATWSWPHQPLIAQLSGLLGVKRFEQQVQGDAMLDLGPAGLERHATPSPMTGSLRFEGGAAELAVRLAARLPADHVQLGVRVTAIEAVPGGVIVTAEGPGGAQTNLRARAVIVALPPRLAAQDIAYSPALPAALAQVLRGTPTWMGHAMKAVVTYKRAFWRDERLSGFAYSYAGPLQEIHDASPQGAPGGALFGFFSAHHPARVAPAAQRRAMVLDQLERAFGPEARRVQSYTELDWAQEGLTSTPEDRTPPTRHPQYGHPLLRDAALDGRLCWAGAETSPLEGGLLEGAVQSGQRAARQVLKLLQNGMFPAESQASSATGP